MSTQDYFDHQGEHSYQLHEYSLVYEPADRLPGNLSMPNAQAYHAPKPGDLMLNHHDQTLMIWNGRQWDVVFTAEDVRHIYASRQKDEHVSDPGLDRFSDVIREAEGIDEEVEEIQALPEDFPALELNDELLRALQEAAQESFDQRYGYSSDRVVIGPNQPGPHQPAQHPGQQTSPYGYSRTITCSSTGDIGEANRE